MRRLLGRNRALTAILFLTLSGALGAAAAAFNFIDVLLFRPPSAVAEPDEVVRMTSATNYIDYIHLRDRVRSLDLAGFMRRQVPGATGDSSPLVLSAECVTPNYFDVLGTGVSAGRAFRPETGRSDPITAAVIGYGFWRRALGGNPDAVGQVLAVAGRPHVIIGVAPRTFTGLDLEPVDVWLDLSRSADVCSFSRTNLLTSDGGAWLRVAGRIRRPFTLATARAELEARHPRSADVRSNEASRPTLQPLHQWRRGRLSRDARIAAWLASGALILLVLACANVASMMALRAIDRRMEIAVRLQLGATRRQVFVQFFAENMALVALCTVGAVVVAAWAHGVLASYVPLLSERVATVRSVAILLGFAVLSGAMSAVIPAVQISKLNQTALLRSGHAVVSGGLPVRNALLVTQFALAYSFLVGGGLLLASVDNLLKQAGFDPRRVIVATVELDQYGIADDQIWETVERMLEALRQIPAVSSVGTSSATLLRSGGSTVSAGIKNASNAPESSMAIVNAVTPDYFATAGTRLLRGRGFSHADNMRSRPVLILSENVARERWPGEDPVGRCAFVGGYQACVEVVGITESRRSGRLAGPTREMFLPASQARLYRFHAVPRTLLVRTDRAPRDVLPAVTGIVERLAPEIPKGGIRPLMDYVDDETRAWRLGAATFQLLGGLAILMAGVGIYAALGWTLRQRSAEIALRLALGATRLRIARMTVRHLGWPLAVGWLAGVGLSFILGHFLQGLLVETSPADVSIQALVSIPLAGVAVCASIGPVLTAVRMSPAGALRDA